MFSRFASFTLPIRTPLVKRTFTDIHEPSCDWRSDVMLTEVTIEDVKDIQKELGSVYLSTTDKPIVYPVQGYIFNSETRRVFVSLIVARGKHRINVPFLVNSGCAGLYIAPDTMTQLGYQDNLPKTTTINVHGFNGLNALLSPADSTFSHLNVLGQKFFDTTDVIKYENTKKGIFQMFHPSQVPQFSIPSREFQK